MKVLIVSSVTPFAWDDADDLAVGLRDNIIAAGQESEILRIPFRSQPASFIPSQMLMVRAFELMNVERVIALQFPAYLIRHPNKTLWVIGANEQVSFANERQNNVASVASEAALQDVVENADRQSFAESRRIFTTSEATRLRIEKHDKVQADILLQPVNDPQLFAGGRQGDYIFAGGRINAMNRQHLLVEAMRHTGRCVKLVIAGVPDRPEDSERLKRAVSESDAQDRIKLELRLLPRPAYSEYVKNCAAVAYLPAYGDSLAPLAAEAATARKAIVTASDSIGGLRLTKRHETGWVADPTPQSIAAAMEEAFSKPSLARNYGVGAFELWRSMGVNWPATVRTLLQ
jgi:glycosyltransferase involved in cell wall biosynthesis